MEANRILDIVCFLSVVLISLWTCLIKDDDPIDHKVRLLKQGMLLTVAADFCLLILNWQEIGIGIFCLVQTTYAVRYNIRDKKRTVLWVGAVAGGILASFLSYGLLTQLKPLYALAAVYSCCLGMAVYQAVRLYVKKELPQPNGRMVLSGMILFLLCDINVALYNVLPAHMTFMWRGEPVSLAFFCGKMIWLCYLPSLILLSMSGRRWKGFYRSISYFRIDRNLRQ